MCDLSERLILFVVTQYGSPDTDIHIHILIYKLAHGQTKHVVIILAHLKHMLCPNNDTVAVVKIRDAPIQFCKISF